MRSWCFLQVFGSYSDFCLHYDYYFEFSLSDIITRIRRLSGSLAVCLIFFRELSQVSGVFLIFGKVVRPIVEE